LYALIALPLVLCAAEVGLRVYDIQTGWFQRQVSDEESLLVPSPTTFVELRPMLNRSAEQGDGTAVNTVAVRINSFGLRGAEPAVPKPPGVYRIVVLGDDAVFGSQLQENETVPAYLEQYLQSRSPLDVEVINAGVPEFCPLLSLLQLRHRLLALQPDLLVLHFDMSDVADDHRVRRHTNMNAAGLPIACSNPAWLAKTSLGNGGLHEQFLLTHWAAKQLGTYWSGKTQSTTERDIDSPLGKYRWLEDNPPNWSIYIQQALTPIEQIKTLAEGSYIRLVVSTCPVPWQVSAKSIRSREVLKVSGLRSRTAVRNRQPFENLAKLTTKLGVPFCEPSTAFQKTEEPHKLFQKTSPGLTSAGNAFYAREIAATLIQSVPSVWSQPAVKDRSASSPRRVRIPK
jgi:hypothetical protein